MKKTKIRKSRIPVLIILALFLATALAACVDTNSGEDIIDNMSVNLSGSQAPEESSEPEVSTQEGYTATPVVKQMINISPSVVAICGSCEENAVVKISGGVKDVEANANGTYFIAEVSLKYEASNLLEITAKVADKEESVAGSVIAKYNATADKRLDGNSVSVGTDSRLYFDKMADDASGTNLYTVSELKKIRTYVTKTINGYNNRANGESVDIIYVLVPNVTTVYPEIFPEGATSETNTTVYDQILDTLSQTRATVIDMRSIYLALKDDETVVSHGGLYRVTDSGLSDYAAYLAYNELMTVISARFPDASPRKLDEFTFKTVSTLGGNLVFYRDADSSLITEQLDLMVPSFSLDLGTNETGSTKLSSIRKYKNAAENDYSYFTTVNSTDNINSVAERWLIKTARSDTLALPNALIYRDDSIFPITDILLERFETCMIAKSGDFDVNLSNAIQYASDNKSVVDYIIVFLSEENMDSAFSLAFAE